MFQVIYRYLPDGVARASELFAVEQDAYDWAAGFGAAIAFDVRRVPARA